MIKKEQGSMKGFYVLEGFSKKKNKKYKALCCDVPVNDKTHRLFLYSKNYFLFNELLEQMIKNGDVVDET